MKTYSCYICKQLKKPDLFYKDSSRSSGVSSRCKSCVNTTAKKLTPEQSAAKQRRQYANRKARGLSATTRTVAIRKRLAAARKRGQHFCEWENRDITFRLFELKAYWNEIWPEDKLHVDHVVPLVHPFVCGLHTHDNLRLITARDNGRKSNHILTEEQEQMLGFREVFVNM